MKIYTSYYGRHEKLRAARLVLVGISYKIPDWAKIDGRLLDLSPDPGMISLAPKHWDSFVEAYRLIVRRLEPLAIVNQIKAISGGRDVALLCWEKPSRHCHRSLVGRWLSNMIELEDDGKRWIVTEWEDAGKPDDQYKLFPAELAGEGNKVKA